MQGRLETAKRAGRSRRRKITATSLAAAFFLAVLVVCTLLLPGVFPRCSWANSALGILQVPLFFLIPMPLFLCLLPTDTCLIKCTAGMIASFSTILVPMCVLGFMSELRAIRDGNCKIYNQQCSDDSRGEVSCFIFYAHGIMLLLVAIFAGIISVFMVNAMAKLHPRSLLNSLCLQMSRFYVTLGFAFTWVWVSDIIAFPDLWILTTIELRALALVSGCETLALGYMMDRSSFRVRAQAWLASRGQAANAAAAIAALIGSKSIHDVQQTAQQMFRYITLDVLTREMMAENTPNPEFYKLSTLGRFGDVDAFLSHSWHDDAASKWTSLQEWRRDFVARKRREPRVWVDKFCIDQKNIEANLTCLPVFLAGCSKLVLFVGETYLSRLWCVIELFVFLEMGGCVEDLEVHAITEEVNSRTLAEQFATFDAEDATCFLPEDRDRLLGVVEAGFGGLEDFSTAVRAILQQTCCGSWLIFAQDSPVHVSRLESGSEDRIVRISSMPGE